MGCSPRGRALDRVQRSTSGTVRRQGGALCKRTPAPEAHLGLLALLVEEQEVIASPAEVDASIPHETINTLTTSYNCAYAHGDEAR